MSARKSHMGSTRRNSTRARRAGSVKPSRRQPAHSLGGTRRSPKPTATEVRSLTKRLEAATVCIFKAQSIVACCRLACASLYDSEHAQEEMVFALEASVDLLGDAAEEIEAIEDEHGRLLTREDQAPQK
jgi:hypothetical protein